MKKKLRHIEGLLLSSSVQEERNSLSASVRPGFLSFFVCWEMQTFERLLDCVKLINEGPDCSAE